MLKARMVLGAVASLMLTSLAMAGDKVELEGVKCVLNSKGAAQATSWAEYKGKKVYFCCDNCKAKFTKKPKKFAVSANAQLVATKQAKQVACPLMGKPVKEGLAVKVSGVDVHLCCGGCKGKLAGKEKEDQLKVVFNEKTFKKAFELAKKEEEK